MINVVRLILITVIAGLGTAVHAAGHMPSQAGAVGTTIAGIIECGQGYTSHELYDVRINVHELYRGEQAWQRLQQVSSSNQPPARGNDYILARIKFEYEARGKPGNCVHDVKRSHYTALSMQDNRYPVPSVVVPQPALSGPLHSGESIDGWIAFEVARTDKKPLMTFSVDDSGAVQHVGKLWFKLYK